MKILWLCNIVLPNFSEEFGIRKYNNGGWITGMLEQLKDRAEIAICCPINDSSRAKDGVCDGHKYYSFQMYADEYHESVKIRFIEIIKDFVPDIIHIWGTESPHTLAMVNACEELGIIDKAIINIQGLVSVIEQHYYADVPDEYLKLKVDGYTTITEERNSFKHRGLYEIEALKKIKHVIGRTDWDEACSKRINPNVCYHFCNEILRDVFYEHIGEWKYENCRKYSIFLSQASYSIKGLHYLLKNMPEIIRDYPNTHIFIGGPNITKPNVNGKIRPYAQYINHLILKNNLAEHITFLGNLDDTQMFEQYMQANVFLSLSAIENESNSISEAALLGCPIISSLVGGVISRTKLFECSYQHNADYMIPFYIKKIFEQTNFSSHSNICSEIVNKSTNSNRTFDIYKKLWEI